MYSSVVVGGGVVVHGMGGNGGASAGKYRKNNWTGT